VKAVISAAIGVARFLYRFVVGDDWTVAVAIILALAATGVVAANHISAWWLVPFVAIFMTGVSLRRATRQHHTP
jgi:multisubunit Na+/H+ antiporter MnhG subunit